MYQALYRTWRPRTFDDVVGQPHITDTLKQQVSSGRLSHAYLFTGTRGTGKTSCAKILSRAVNCQASTDGNPCNQCPACMGIENGSILDVLELDAASNNGVDQVRALRDEAVYTPAAVGKRVYIVDEVHMLSTPAFNALLKILEEPPPHLMFILATTELHKVPATIRSRCQQFAFKRILPTQIAQRLDYIARQEGIDLTPQGSGLLARLADGGLRDALSLLDQCSGGTQRVDEQQVLDTLGLAGNVETARLMELIARRDIAAALDAFARLYAGGRDISSALGELSALARDLLLRKTAPQGCAALLTGGYDEGTMRALGEQFAPQRLLHLLRALQDTLAALPHSAHRRTEGELCLIRLCDESLDDSPLGLSARIARLEQLPVGGTLPAAAPVQTMAQALPQTAPVVTQASPPTPKHEDTPPPWEMEERPPLPQEPELARTLPNAAPPVPTPAPAPVQTGQAPSLPPPSIGGDVAFWPGFSTGLKGKVPPSAFPYLANPAKVTGCWAPGVLTLWVDSPFTKAMLDKPAITGPMAQAAETAFGGPARIAFQVGTPPVDDSPTPVVAAQATPPKADALDDLLAFGAQFDSIVIQD